MRRFARDRSEQLTALDDLQIVEPEAMPGGWYKLLIGRVQGPIEDVAIAMESGIARRSVKPHFIESLLVVVYRAARAIELNDQPSLSPPCGAIDGEDPRTTVVESQKSSGNIVRRDGLVDAVRVVSGSVRLPLISGCCGDIANKHLQQANAAIAISA